MEKGTNIEEKMQEVAIVGAGLAGLCLAVALTHRNIPFHIYEGRSSLGYSHGYIMGIDQNAITALNGIRPGLFDHVSQFGTFASSLSFSLLFAGEPVSLFTHQLNQKQVLLIEWSHLQHALATLIPPQSISFNHKFISYHPIPPAQVSDERSVQARFMSCEDREVQIKCKMLVGADGVWSAMRKQMVGDSPRYLKLMTWSAILDDPQLTVFRDLQRGEVRLLNETDASARCIIANSGHHTLWLLRKLDPSQSLAASLPNGRTRKGGQGCKEQILKELDSMTGSWEELKRAIRATDESLISERLAVDRVPLDTWSDFHGHVLIIGDAAHALYPEIGQGFKTACEDAHQLGDMLVRACDGNSTILSASAIEAAVKSFEEIRIPRMKRFHAYACYKTMIPEFQPEWANNLTKGESQEVTKEFSKWVCSYPLNHTSDPHSKYFNDDIVTKSNKS